MKKVLHRDWVFPLSKDNVLKLLTLLDQSMHQPILFVTVCVSQTMASCTNKDLSGNAFFDACPNSMGIHNTRTVSEISDYLVEKCTLEHATQVLLVLDLNKDGIIDRNEFVKGHKAGTLAVMERIERMATGSLEALVALTRNGDAQDKTSAAGALSTLARDSAANKAAIVAAGGIEALVALTRDGDATCKAAAAGALATLLTGAEAIA